MALSLTTNDGILLISVLYTMVDLQVEWTAFESCHNPIHQWLLVSFITVIAFRLTQILGMHMSGPGSGSFLLDLRQKSTPSRILVGLTWLVVLPFFIFWTGLGTLWLTNIMWNTPQCMPTQTHMWFLVFWLALSYIWILIHVGLGTVAWILEQRVRRSEQNLSQIQDDDMVSRWGQVNRVEGYTAVVGVQESGLSAAQISELPCGICNAASDAESGDAEELDCPICLTGIECGDKIRQLGVCGHTFHKSCIDLWLLRRADCPLCKRSVLSSPSAEGSA